MKMDFKFYSLALGVMAGFALPLCVQAVSIATEPVGFVAPTVEGTGGSGDKKLSFISLGVVKEVSFSGNLESPLTANTLTDTDASWTADQFNGANGAYYVEVTSGSAAGVMSDITATASSTLTIADDLSGVVAAGDTYVIRKHWTIGDVFGANNEAGLQSGTQAIADQVQVFNAQSQVIVSYYYQEGSPIGGDGWRRAGDLFADQATTVIYPTEGIFFERKQNTNVKLPAIVGSAKSGATIIPVSGGINLVTLPTPKSVALKDLGVYTGNANTGVADGLFSTADTIEVWNGSSFDKYYYQTGSPIGGEGWRRSGDLFTDQQDVVVPGDQAILIRRVSSATGFNWTAPAAF